MYKTKNEIMNNHVGTRRALSEKDKGITLIALVITIIVLLILAGLTLTFVIGENGLFAKARTAKDKHNEQAATETLNLKITNVQISTYTQEQRMPTLKELADNFCDDDDFKKVEEKTEGAGLTKISNNNPSAIIVALKAYPEYDFEINSSLQLAKINGVEVATVPTNENDTIVSMTKGELDSYINQKLQNYYTKSETYSKSETDNKIGLANTTWTELASTNLTTYQSKTVDIDEYNFIAVEIYWNGTYGQIIVPVTRFKNSSSSNVIGTGYSDGRFVNSSNTYYSVWVDAYYTNGTLYYHVYENCNGDTAIYCKVYGIK